MITKEVISQVTGIESRNIEGVTVYSPRLEPTGTEIVRCRDCIHFRPDNPSTHTPSKCSGVFAFVHPDPDGFCAWGKRVDE